MENLLTILKNASYKSIIYYIKWSYLKFIGDDSVTNTKEVLERVKTCTPCFEKGACIYCGCNFEGLVTSRKDCEKWKK